MFTCDSDYSCKLRCSFRASRQYLQLDEKECAELARCGKRGTARQRSCGNLEYSLSLVKSITCERNRKAGKCVYSRGGNMRIKYRGAILAGAVAMLLVATQLGFPQSSARGPAGDGTLKSLA